MRLYKVNLDHETDLILIAGLTGLHPMDIDRYTLVVRGTDGGIRISGDACCLAHDLLAVKRAAEITLATLVPCASEHG